MKTRNLMAAAVLMFLASRTPLYGIEASIDLGGQAVQGDTGSSKFEEYTDVPRGFYVDHFDLTSRGATSYYVLSGYKPGLRDQRVDLEIGQWGKQRFSLSYNQTPHNLSNSAQTFLQDHSNGVYTLPDNMQSQMQTSTANAAGFLSESPLVPLRVDRKQGALAYAFNPAEHWRMKMSYSAEKKEGDKAIGVTYGHGQIQEALEPVHYQTHDLNFGTEFTGQDMGFTAGYRYSNFVDEIKALTVDNPFRLTDAALSAAGASAPATARLTLPPSSQNHQANFAFTTKLPAKSRLSIASTYSVQTQNDAFQPLTSNQAILNDPRLGALSDTQLHGRVDTWNTNLKWNWKPVQAASANVHAIHYRVDNKTPSLLINGYVPYDSSFSTSTPTSTFKPATARLSTPVGYNKTNMGADLYYSLMKAVSFKLAYDWEQMLRDFRESSKTTEDTYTASLNFKPHPRFSFRPSYQYKRRSVHDYDAERVAEETLPLGEGTSLGQLPELRKYDQASRERNKVGARADWDLTDSLNLGLDTGYTRDAYVADYGLQAERSLYYSVDLGFMPSDRISFYGGYTWERLTTDTRSRYRETGLDVAANDWQGQLDDLVQTVNASMHCTLIKEKLDTNLGWNLSFSRGTQQANNPNTLQGTAGQIASAIAQDLPNTYTRLNQVTADLRYHWSANITMKAQYEYQRYTETDWSQDSLDVYQTVWNKSVFLGATQPSYEAHIVSLGLSYRFL